MSAIPPLAVGLANPSHRGEGSAGGRDCDAEETAIWLRALLKPRSPKNRSLPSVMISNLSGPPPNNRCSHVQNPKYGSNRNGWGGWVLVSQNYQNVASSCSCRAFRLICAGLSPTISVRFP